MAQNKTLISQVLNTEENSIEIIHKSIDTKNNNNMNSHKFWRPFESPVKSHINGTPYLESAVTSAERRINGELSQYTFDLYHEDTKKVPPYLSSSPQQLIISSTIKQHLCGNTLINSLRAHPYRCDVSPSKQMLDRFVPIKPKPIVYEKRQKVVTKQRTEFTCDISGCEKSFRFRSALENHRLVHSDERKFCCVQCGKRYKQLSGLYSHESVKHLGKTKKFVCDSCGEWFVDYRNLRIHEYNQHESDEFTKFVAKAMERSSAEFISGHTSDDSNHSH